MKKSMKYFGLIPVLSILIGSSVFAVNYRFSFTTSGTQTGATGSTAGSTTAYAMTIDRSSNVTTSRYITCHVVQNSNRVSGYVNLTQPGSSVAASYIGKVSGTVSLKGSPSMIGASATGNWNP